MLYSLEFSCHSQTKTKELQGNLEAIFHVFPGLSHNSKKVSSIKEITRLHTHLVFSHVTTYL